MNEENSPLNEKSKVTLQRQSQAESVLDVSTLPKNDDATPLDTSVIDEQWAEMAQDWQSQPVERTDIQALLKQTKRRTWLAKSLLALDIVATLGIIIALIYGLYQGDWGAPTIAYLSFGAILSIVFVYYEIKIRSRTWQQSCDSPDRAIDNAIAGCQSSIKYIKLIKLSCYLLIPGANWYIYAMLTISQKSPWPPFIVMNIFILIVWLITHHFDKKRNAELKQLITINSK